MIPVSPTPAQLTLLRRMARWSWNRAGELKTSDYRHPISVDNALRPLRQMGYVETTYLTPQIRGHRLTDAGVKQLKDQS